MAETTINIKGFEQTIELTYPSSATDLTYTVDGSNLEVISASDGIVNVLVYENSTTTKTSTVTLTYTLDGSSVADVFTIVQENLPYIKFSKSDEVNVYGGDSNSFTVESKVVLSDNCPSDYTLTFVEGDNTRGAFGEYLVTKHTLPDWITFDGISDGNATFSVSENTTGADRHCKLSALVIFPGYKDDGSDLYLACYEYHNGCITINQSKDTSSSFKIISSSVVIYDSSNWGPLYLNISGKTGSVTCTNSSSYSSWLNVTVDNVYNIVTIDERTTVNNTKNTGILVFSDGSSSCSINVIQYPRPAIVRPGGEFTTEGIKVSEFIFPVSGDTKTASVKLNEGWSIYRRFDNPYTKDKCSYTNDGDYYKVTITAADPTGYSYGDLIWREWVIGFDVIADDGYIVRGLQPSGNSKDLYKERSIEGEIKLPVRTCSPKIYVHQYYSEANIKPSYWTCSASAVGQLALSENTGRLALVSGDWVTVDSTKLIQLTPNTTSSTRYATLVGGSSGKKDIYYWGGYLVIEQEPGYITLSESSLEVGVSGGTGTITVTSSATPLTITNTNDWISVDSSTSGNKTTLTITVDANTGDDRTGTFRISLSDSLYQDVTVTQGSLSVRLSIVDSDGELIPGVSYTLYYSDGSKAISGTTDDGYIDFIDSEHTTSTKYSYILYRSGYQSLLGTITSSTSKEYTAVQMDEGDSTYLKVVIVDAAGNKIKNVRYKIITNDEEEVAAQSLDDETYSSVPSLTAVSESAVPTVIATGISEDGTVTLPLPSGKYTVVLDSDDYDPVEDDVATVDDDGTATEIQLDKTQLTVLCEGEFTVSPNEGTKFSIDYSIVSGTKGGPVFFSSDSPAICDGSPDTDFYNHLGLNDSNSGTMIAGASSSFSIELDGDVSYKKAIINVGFPDYAYSSERPGGLSPFIRTITLNFTEESLTLAKTNYSAISSDGSLNYLDAYTASNVTDIAATSDDDWLTVTVSDGYVKFTPTTNTGTSRTGTITVTGVGTVSSKIITQTITITQFGTAQTTSTYYWRVRVKDTLGNLLEGVSFTVTGSGPSNASPTTADGVVSYGQYEGTSANTIYITLEKSGYQTITSQAITAKTNANWQEIVMYYAASSKTYTVNATVNDSTTNKPISGVTWSLVKDGSSTVCATGTTGSDGLISYTDTGATSASKFTLTLEKTGYGKTKTTVSSYSDGTNVSVTMTPSETEETNYIALKVVSSSYSTAIPGASFTIYKDDNKTQILYSGTTGSDGTASFEFTKGTYYYSVSASGYSSDEDDITTTTSSTNYTKISLTPDKLSITLKIDGNTITLPQSGGSFSFDYTIDSGKCSGISVISRPSNVSVDYSTEVQSFCISGTSTTDAIGTVKLSFSDPNYTSSPVIKTITVLFSEQSITTNPLRWDLSSSSSATKTFTVTSVGVVSDLKTHTTNGSWLTISEISDGRFTITAAENTTSSSRSASVVVFGDGINGSVVSTSVPITQPAASIASYIYYFAIKPYYKDSYGMEHEIYGVTYALYTKNSQNVPVLQASGVTSKDEPVAKCSFKVEGEKPAYDPSVYYLLNVQGYEGTGTTVSDSYCDYSSQDSSIYDNPYKYYFTPIADTYYYKAYVRDKSSGVQLTGITYYITDSSNNILQSKRTGDTITYTDTTSDKERDITVVYSKDGYVEGRDNTKTYTSSTAYQTLYLTKSSSETFTVTSTTATPNFWGYTTSLQYTVTAGSATGWKLNSGTSAWISDVSVNLSSNKITYTVSANSSSTDRTGKISIDFLDAATGNYITWDFPVKQSKQGSSGSSSYIPAWRDTYYNFTYNPVEYTITSEGSEIFSGKAVAAPGSSTPTINVGAILRNYVGSNDLTFGSTGTEGNGEDGVFQICTNRQTEAQYVVHNDWSYDTSMNYANSGLTLSNPVNGHFDYRMYFLFTGYQTSSKGYTVSVDSSTSTFTLGAYTSTYKLHTKVNSSIYITDKTSTVSFTGGSKQITYGKQVCGCRYALYYRNRKGGWDSFVIEGKSTRTDNYDKGTYNTSFDNTSNGDFGKKNYHKDITTKYTLNTGWLSDSESENLAFNLLASPQVYLHDMEEGIVKPVIISNSSAEYKTFLPDRKMISYSIEVEDSQTKLFN